MERALGFAVVYRFYRYDKDQASVLEGNPDLAARVYARLETALAKAQEFLQQKRGCFDLLVEESFNMQSLGGKDVCRTIKNK